MPEPKDRAAKNTKYVSAGVSSYFNCWMLRTPGKKDAWSAASVDFYGNYKMSGDTRFEDCYLRPAIWIQ